MLKTNSIRSRFSYTAKEDIIVYKSMMPTDMPDRVKSPYRRYCYHLGQEHEVKLSSPLLSGEVHSGMHAFVNLSDAHENAEHLTTYNRQKATFYKVMDDIGWYGIKFSESTWNQLLSVGYEAVNAAWKSVSYNRYKVYKCVIPKGAKYYKGNWNPAYTDNSILTIAANKLTIQHDVDDPPQIITDTTTNDVETFHDDVVSAVETLLNQSMNTVN